jgi:hypothetical protein
MINCYTRNIKYKFNVKSLINTLVKVFFVPLNLKYVAIMQTSFSNPVICAKNSNKLIIFLAICLLMMGGCRSLFAQTTIYSQNFEGTHGWTLAGNFGVGSQTSPAAYSGNNLYTVRNGNYATDVSEVSNYSVSPTISIAGYHNTSLQFMSYSDFETDYDYGYVYISNDNGGSWTRVQSFTGTESGWTLHTIDISAYADNQSQVKIKFSMLSDYSEQRTGWNIDNVIIAGTPLATLTTSTTALNGFNYIYDFGPSALQSFTVSGTGLSNNITITASANYEISVDGANTFTSTSATASKSSTTTVYVRLKAGLPVGSYNGESITLTSSTITKTVTCSGFVSAKTPSIIAGGGIDCSTNTINLISTYSAGVSNVYWTGPNSFYSTTQNPTITGATSVNEGTYTVTGSVLSGVNLITNGDFEAGNTGFTSSYIYKTPAGNMTVWDPATYTVVADPNVVHKFFSNCSDHTIGGTTPVGQQMIINGASTANVSIWKQTVLVAPNTAYQFIYWVQTVATPNPSELQLFANGTLAGPVYTANTATCSWKRFVYNWNSGSNTTVELSLVNQNTNGNGNDFALDDISFQPVVQISSSVKVTLSKAPSLLIVNATATTVNPGTNVTFSTVPTNGGTSPTFQWYVNSTPVPGATSPTYSYVPLTGDKVTCVMTPVGACVSTPATSNTVDMIVSQIPNYWVGTNGTSWGVPTNWSAGFVPKPGDDVIFATAVNNGGNAAQNDLYVDTNHSIGNLTNQTTNRKLVVTPAKILVVNQKITTNSADQILIQSVPNQPNGSLVFPNATNVKATVEMYSKATRNATGITVGGNTYFYAWQYFGIPLSSVIASPTFDGSFVRKNDEWSTNTLGKWTSLTNSDVLTSFRGYEITQDAPTTIVFQGTLVNDNKSIDLAYTSTAYDPGQNMLANPYTAAIDIRKLTFGSTTAVENAVYLYNTGSFGQWSNNNGETTYDTGASLPGQYIAIPQSAAGTGSIPYDIPSMSSFMVKAINGPVPAGITINYSSVITKNVNPQRAPQNKVSTDKVYMEISLKGERYGDRMWLINEPGTTRGFDNGWDGYKLNGAVGTPKLFAMEESGNYQISTSSDLSNTCLGFQAGVDLEDTLTFKSENLELKYDGMYLVDLVENKVIDITKSGTQYVFKAESTVAPVKRFKIVTEPYVKNVADLTTRMKVFNDNDAVFVDNSSNEKGELYFYDIMGRYLKKEIFGPNSISSFLLFSTSGAYVVKAVTSSEKVSKRIIVK